VIETRIASRRQAVGPVCVRPVRLGLMRGFDLRMGDRRVTLPHNAQRLVALLALHDRPSPRLYVAGVLWLDSNEERSTASLRSTIWRVGQAAPGLILASKTHLQIAPEVGIDFVETTRIAEALINGTLDCQAAALDQHALGGELLPGWYDDWVSLERERQRQLRLHALEALCGHLTTARRFGQAIDAGLAAVRGEPLRESAHRVLIAAHLAEGNCGEALRQYHTYRQLLHDELGLDPSAQMMELVSAITI
jgi:DNA-binding SARP family transcriptional activator